MPSLVLGPMLRHVDGTTATIWVETDTPCDVEVSAGDASGSGSTFTVHGHHFALVDVTGLTPGSRTEYGVTLDGVPVWPEPGSDLPPSVIPTPAPGAPMRVAFGSCRTSVPHDAEHRRSHGVDMLHALGLRIGDGTIDLPDLLLMVGDQVYADEPSDEMVAWLRQRRDLSRPPFQEVADFEEYTHLYLLAWSDPVVRWVLSTIPTCTIFDDHDLRDDWNISQAWRDDITTQPWWRPRVTGAFASYWIYQHAGNLSPKLRADDPFWQAATAGTTDAGEAFDELAWRADQEPDSYRWSYTRRLDGSRLVVVDSRAARSLGLGHRAMVDAAEHAWLDGEVGGDVDHLLLATSLPFLLPKGVHHVEQWSEAVCDGIWGRWAAQRGERLRRMFDLDHWAAFGRSFEAMTEMVRQVSTGRRGEPPASFVFLSGDVHYSYLARASVPGTTKVWQATCSPIRNPLDPKMRLLNVVAQFGVATLVGDVLARAARVRRAPIRWDTAGGPWFDNAIAVLDLDGRQATIRWLAAVSPEGDDTADPVVIELAQEQLG